MLAWKWLVMLLMLAVVRPAAAGPNEEAFAAFVKGDYQTAVRITRPLVERGDAQAQASLGAMYEAGQGVPKDYAAAVSWMRQSAEQGNPNGQGGLADMYAEGIGVPKDYVLGYMWYNLAAAEPNYGYRARNRDDLADKMSREQIAEAQKLSREWMPKRKDWLHGLWEFFIGAR